MGFCFVIQPFDDPNDKRYEDVFRPAIEAADLNAYRVDRDPSASILIDDVENKIRTSDACLADITTDNPNVWYELGYALAARKEVVLVCAEGRDRFPFDIQHRKVITYKAESPRDFDKLKTEIADRLRARLAHRLEMEEVASGALAAPQAGLDPQQLAALVAVAQRQDLDEGLSINQIRGDMNNVGFTDIATTLALRGLARMGLVEAYNDADYNGDSFIAYRATEAGLDWLETNSGTLSLRRGPTQPLSANDLEDLPF
jgi:nucleoside 2-deoxyribosyltransferase